MEATIRGWVNYFSIAKAKSKMQELDELVKNAITDRDMEAMEEGENEDAQPYKVRHQTEEGLRVE
jgi:hypothetical protein